MTAILQPVASTRRSHAVITSRRSNGEGRGAAAALLLGALLLVARHAHALAPDVHLRPPAPGRRTRAPAPAAFDPLGYSSALPPPRALSRGGVLRSAPDGRGATILSREPLPVAFDPRLAGGLVGTQSLLIVVAAGAAAALKIPAWGAGGGFDPWAPGAVSAGLAATVPLIAFAGFFEVVEKAYEKFGAGENGFITALQDVNKATQKSVLVFLGSERKWPEACVTSLGLGAAAGIGEELLFRGVLQSTLTEYTGLAPVSVVVTSVVFGLLHFATPLYAFLAFVASLYFGFLFQDPAVDNLAIPMICHGVYDVVALLFAHYTVTGLTDTQRAELMEELD